MFQLIQTLKADLPAKRDFKRDGDGDKPQEAFALRKASREDRDDRDEHIKSIMDDTEMENYRIPSTPSQKLKTRKFDSPKKIGLQLNAYGIPLAQQNSTAVARKSSVSDLSDRIRVCVRKRPVSKKEQRLGHADIAPVSGRRNIAILESK